MSTVTSFECGFSAGTALRLPYALARLSCGHMASVVLRPMRYVCHKCATETLTTAQRCACGCFQFDYLTTLPNPHLEADRVTRIGDEVGCAACENETEALAWLAALDPATVAHARYREWCGAGLYYLYRRDTSSPSGVLLIRAVPATKAIDAALASKRVSPLSPTEGLECR